MKKIFMFLFLTIISYSQITWTDISSTYSLPTGVKLFYGQQNSPKLKVWYLDVDLNNPNIAIRPYLCTHPDGKLGITNFVTYVGAIAGINGGFFDTYGTQSYSAVVYPLEVVAKNIAIVTRPSGSYTVTRSLFGRSSDGSLAVDWIYHFGNEKEDIYKFSQPTPNAEYNPAPPPQMTDGTQYNELWWGLGGGPTLVKNSTINITYNQEVFFGSGVPYDTKDPRTAVGYTANNHVIMLVADGRKSSWSEGLTLPELAQLMIDLNCVEAMNLDGGGSTQMAVGNSLINKPEGGTYQRPIPTILAVVWADSAQGPADTTYDNIIDTGDQGVIINGSWPESSNSGYWGTTKARYNQKGTGNDFVKFPLGLHKSAVCEIYAWWVHSTNRCNDTPFIITHKNGVDTVRINQTINGSSWQFIGEYTFSGNSSDEVKITDYSLDTDPTHLYVVADAIRIISYDKTFLKGIQLDLKVFLQGAYR